MQGTITTYYDDLATPADIHPCEVLLQDGRLEAVSYEYEGKRITYRVTTRTYRELFLTGSNGGSSLVLDMSDEGEVFGTWLEPGASGMWKITWAP